MCVTPWRRTWWVCQRTQHWQVLVCVPGSVAGSGSREYSEVNSPPLPLRSYHTATESGEDGDSRVRIHVFLNIQSKWMLKLETDGSRRGTGVGTGVTLSSSSQNITSLNGIAPSSSSCSAAGCCCCHRNRLRGHWVTDVWLRAVRGLKVGGGRGRRSLGVERRVGEREAAGSTGEEGHVGMKQKNSKSVTSKGQT